MLGGGARGALVGVLWWGWCGGGALVELGGAQVGALVGVLWRGPEALVPQDLA